MQALGIQHAHVAGLSLGAATGMWLAAKYPDKVNKQNIQHAELVIFEGCAHAPIYEKVDEFNQTTLEFLNPSSPCWLFPRRLALAAKPRLRLSWIYSP